MSLYKNMVFTSAGNNTNFIDLWPSELQEYDIYVMYYGDNDIIYNKYKSKVKYIEKSKGSKFQNFYNFYNKYPEIIDMYDYFFIVDDDIIIKPTDINKLFDIAKQYNLLICGPSFSKNSKISWAHTLNKPNRLLTYVNMVEVNVPVFNRCALDKLMKVYKPTLIGWGIDILYIWINGISNKESYAIIHNITCVNPHDKDKECKTRELYNIPGAHNRVNTWNQYANSIGCPHIIPGREYSTINISK